MDTVRRFAQDNSLKVAVQKAVDACIEKDILKDFLLANKAEVMSMTIFEYDEEQHHKTLHDEGFEEGYNVAVAEKDKEIAQKDEEIARLKKLLADTHKS